MRKPYITILLMALIIWMSAIATTYAEEELTAEDYFQTAVKTYGNNPYTGEQKDGAIKLYTRAIKLKPEFHQAYNARGHMFALLDEYTQAIKDYSKAIELNGNQAEYWYNRGTIYGYVGKHQEAVSDLNRAIELDPKNASAYYQRGAEKYAIGKRDESKQDYERAVQLDPGYKGYGNYKNILEELSYTIRKGLEKKASNYEGVGAYQAAADGFDIVDRLKPLTSRTFSSQEPYHYVDRAKVYAKVGRYERAIEVANMGIKTGTKGYLDSLLLWRGYSYASIGNKEQALKDYEDAIKSYGHNPIVYLSRGEAHEKLGEYRMAIEDYKKAPTVGMGGAKFRAEVYCHLGRLYHKMGDYSAARQAYQQALTIITEDRTLGGIRSLPSLDVVPEILNSWEYFYWGEAYEYLGKYTEAKARYQSAFKSNRELKPLVPQKYWIDLEDDGLPIKLGGALH